MKCNVDPNAKFNRNSLFSFGDELLGPTDTSPQLAFSAKEAYIFKVSAAL
jgi:hypothetical protein